MQKKWLEKMGGALKTIFSIPMSHEIHTKNTEYYLHGIFTQ